MPDMTCNVHREARTLFDQHVKPLLDEILEFRGENDAEYFAGSIVYHLRGELGWSVAYYSKPTRFITGAWRRTATKTS